MIIETVNHINMKEVINFILYLSIKNDFNWKIPPSEILQLLTLILFTEIMRQSGFSYKSVAKTTNYEPSQDSDTTHEDYSIESAVLIDNLKGKLPEVHFKKLTRILEDSSTPDQFYRYQMMHTLGKNEEIKRIGIIFDDSLKDKEWINCFRSAIQQINKAAPGLFLVQGMPEKIHITIFEEPSSGCYSQGNIYNYSKPIIVVQTTWSGSKAGTSTHELMHALGFSHEHQRRDGDNYYKLKRQTNPSQSFIVNYEKQENIRGLTSFDPYSIMCYHQGQTLQRTDAKIWALKLMKERSQRLSELDKVGLNILYPPCVSQRYKPVKSSITGMFYCGRNVMNNHNVPARSLTDGFCGPNNGANCPACRVLVNPEFKKQIGDKRWQGWSGLVYCGGKCDEKISRIPGHDGFCGPNNGYSCKTCMSFV